LPSTPTLSPEKKLYCQKATPVELLAVQKYNSIVDLTISLEKQVISSVNHDELLPKMLFPGCSIECDSFEFDLRLPNGWELFDHQRYAIQECFRWERTILAFDMGLGKTMISLAWAQTVSKRLRYTCLTIVVAPCTLIDNWKREAAILDFKVLTSNRDVTQSTERLPSCFFFSWAKVPDIATINSLLSKGFNSFLVIADEAHAMQSLTSQRTQAMLALCGHQKCAGVVLSTGTPMKNGRPSNLLPLLIAIRHPIARNRLEYEKRYCNARKTSFCAWDTSGASNLAELREKIGPYILRKTKVTN